MKILKQPLLPFFILVALGLNACSTNAVISKPNITSEQSSAHNVTAVDLSEIKSLQSFSAKLAKHRAVLVGESHTDYGNHLNQLAVIKSMHKHWGDNTSIGLEMIQQPYQSFLDNYIAGKISEHEMLRGTEWYDRWRFDFRLYRPIFDYAKENKIPLVALNIPKEVTKRISKKGLKGLTVEQRKLLPKVLDISNKDYKARIKDVFSMHSHTSSKGFEKFFESQLAWDEGMAFAAANYLNKYSAKRMVILAGGGHVINRQGIPDRLERHIHSKPAVVLNNINGVPSAKNGDYLLFSAEAKLPVAGKIGISMDNVANNGGVIIASVSKHGAGSKAKLQKGDLIKKIGTTVIQNSTDVMLWALDKKPDYSTTFVIERKSKLMTLPLTLGKPRRRVRHF
ncbi:MAG: ChaN family lipoprotein [Cocleimonas sp.]